MKQLFLTLVALTAVALSACAQNTKNKATEMNKQTDNKALVVFFSATGNTKAAAQQIAKVTEADLFEIVPEQPYTEADLDWRNKQSRSTREMNDLKYRPSVKNKLQHPEQYKTVYLGFPIWWYTAPTIVNTFIEQTDLKGKQIIVFATSGGSGSAKSVQDLQKAYPELQFKDGGLLNHHTLREAEELVEKTKQ